MIHGHREDARNGIDGEGEALIGSNGQYLEAVVVHFRTGALLESDG